MFRSEDGARLCMVFALDYCDHEGIGWVASQRQYCLRCHTKGTGETFSARQDVGIRLIDENP